MAKYEHQLPSIIEPTGTRCVPVFLPDDPDYISLFLRAVRVLTFDRHYQRDESKNALTVRKVWADVTLNPLVDALYNLQTCGGEFPTELDNCVAYPLTSPFINYHPHDPFDEPDFSGGGYAIAPFQTNVGNDTLGYLDTDVFVRFDSIPLFQNFLDLLAVGMPSIEVITIGSGQIELDLIATILGGFAVVKVGSPPNLIDLFAGILDDNSDNIDLSTDIALPTETDFVIQHEVNIDAPVGVETKTYITFVPAIDDALIPLRFGGGIRSIQLCGFETSGVCEMPIRQSPIDNCILEQQQIDGTWLDVANLSLCNDAGVGIVTTPRINELRLSANFTNNTGSWATTNELQFDHTFTCEKAYIWATFAASNTVAGSMSQYRVIVDSLTDTSNMITQNNSTAAVTLSAGGFFENLTTGIGKTIALQSKDLQGSARIYKAASVTFHILEICNSTNQTEIDQINQQIQTILDSLGDNMATVDEICEGVKCAIVDVAQTIAAGVNSDISVTVDDAGNVIVDTGSANNGGIINADSSAIYLGKIISVVNGFQSILKDLDTFFDAGKIDTVAQYYIENLYGIDDTSQLLLAITSYFSYRTQPNDAYSIVSDDLASHFYCDGIFLQSMTRFALFDLTGNAIQLDDMFINLFKAVSQSQIDIWLDNGDNTPDYGYVSFPCYRFPNNIGLINDASARWGADSGNSRWNNLWVSYPSRNTHKMIVEISGWMTNDDTGEKYNGLFLVAVDSSATKLGFSGLINASNTAINAAYGDTVYEIDKTVFQVNIQVPAQNWLSGIRTLSTPNWGANNVSGEITLTRIDLGII